MTRTPWRALRTELLRGAAPVASLATLAGGAGMLYSDRITWAGQWMQFAASLRDSMYVIGALALAAGAWQAGRDVRRRSTEQLAATPRPRWQSVAVAWVAVTLGCWLGLLIAVASGAALVAPVATYTGGGWWWLIVVAFIALATMSALGVALGRLIPYRLTGPIAAIAVYGLLILAHDEADALGEARWLATFVRSYESVGRTLSFDVHVQQALWFGGLTAALLMLAAARRRVFVVVPAAVATTGAALLISGANAEVAGALSKWEPDPEARELVCTADELVCMPRAEAFLLDEVTPHVLEALARFEGVPGGPSRAVNDYDPSTSDGQQLSINAWPTITGDLEPDETWMIVDWHPPLNCVDEQSDASAGTGTRADTSLDEDHYLVVELATMWAVDDPRPEAQEALEVLQAMPEADQKAWIGDVIAAAESCDTRALDSLSTPWDDMGQALLREQVS